MAQYPRSNRKRYQLQKSPVRKYFDAGYQSRPCYDVWGFWLLGDKLRWTIVYQGFGRKDCHKWIETHEKARKEREW
jgi:hypothetical protein